MTIVTIKREGGHINHVKCDGHACYNMDGEDIVCAALSSIVQTAVLGLMLVAGINVDLKRDETIGYLELILPPLQPQTRHDADMILETMLCGIADLHEGYSDFIELEAK